MSTPTASARPALRRPRATARPRRSAGVQRHPRDQGAAAGAQAQWREGRGTGRTRAGTYAGAGAGPYQPPTRDRCIVHVRRDASRRPSKGGTTISSCCDSKATCSRCSSVTATCRCRRTSPTPTVAMDVERYQTVYARAPGRGGGADGRTALHAGAAGRAARQGSAVDATDAARRRGHVPAGAQRRDSTTIACTASGTTMPTGDGGGGQCGATRRPAHRRGRHDQPARARVRRARAPSRYRAGAARPHCSSRPASAFASSIG